MQLNQSRDTLYTIQRQVLPRPGPARSATPGNQTGPTVKKPRPHGALFSDTRWWSARSSECAGGRLISLLYTCAPYKLALTEMLAFSIPSCRSLSLVVSAFFVCCVKKVESKTAHCIRWP